MPAAGSNPGTEKWDLILLAAMVAEIPLATLDAGRMGWSNVPLWVVLAGFAYRWHRVTTWCQAVNPFFEPGVRIQKGGQRVITSGPYTSG